MLGILWPRSAPGRQILAVLIYVLCWVGAAMDAEADASLFCPPALKSACYPNVDISKVQRGHSQMSRWIWLSAIHDLAAPQSVCREGGGCITEWEAFSDVLATTARIDCIIGYWPCYSSLVGAAVQLQRLCAAFRARAESLIETMKEEDPEVETPLRAHMCYHELEASPAGNDGLQTMVVHEHLGRIMGERAMRVLNFAGQQPPPQSVAFSTGRFGRGLMCRRT
eukprot:TRINITY_DN49362_c0_g1_i2.p1 TRINITY_DN49362_c0_g1~~TRINITY_DN49362_c0_g1_i2.p1  ORF type:complete len:224 (-),score=29.17 TRINITY_DN49362_c0_g1_i2:994-1665(-)